MKWTHTCSLEWMKERQHFLCASEVKKLIPFTKTGRPKKIGDQDYAQIWANKQRELTTDDCESSGAAARGHILEPYAIDAFNNYATKQGWEIRLHHWDDIVVNKKGSLAYSPDALDIHPPSSADLHLVSGISATILGEVKSYSVDSHIDRIMTDKMQLEERWQIATAFAADDMLEEAWLIFYNPQLEGDLSLGIFRFDRNDLEDEIAQVKAIELKWEDFKMGVSTFLASSDAILADAGESERSIIQSLELTSKLNPCA